MKTTLFLADLHLEDSELARTGWFLSFLDGPAQRAEAVYILGDLFEFWIGDDALSECARQVAIKTSALNESGIPCYFIHGNRDFLLGESYAGAAGMQLLPETRVVDLYGTSTLLLHGDSLCTDDSEYQVFRQQVRNPAWQAGVLALPIEDRLQLARSARDASLAHTGSTSMEIMDVNASAVAEAFRQHGVSRMIHGHTHRQAVHTFDLDGNTVERIVLADWYSEGSYLEVSAKGASSITL